MKKKALVLAIYMACATPTIGTAKPLVTNFSALNLGEVKSHSNLGEPFKGIIPILFTSRKQAKQLKVRLAPKSIFAKLGAEKSADLKYLKFKVKTLRKKPVIVVSSSRPINSPILNFILEIESNKGVTYQDYTVMLDPPKSKTGSKTKSKTVSKAATVATKTKKKKARSKTYSSPTASRKSISRKSVSKYRVKSGDTLSKIAKNYRRKGISLKKMMKSIHRSNPKAFIRNDINKLKKGVVLHIPSKKQIKTNVKRKAKNSEKYKTGKIKKSAQQTNKLKTYKVKPGDTLSKITKKYVYKGVSFTKMMKAIFIANPKAFSKNKMTVLMAGARLRIPTYVELVNKKAKNKNTAVLPAVKIRPKTAKPSNTHQNISETSLSPQTQQAIKNQADNQIALDKKLPFNNHSSEDSITQELIETLENSNATISNLQKRIRELRGNLSSLTNNYSDLTKMLTDDYFLLKIKEELGQKNIQTLINEYKNYSQLTTEAKVRHTNLVKKSVDFVSKKENQSINTFGSNHTPIAENSLSLKDLSYTILALLLGIVLIRYRKYIYSYSSISYDLPKYYTSTKDKVSYPKEKQLSFSDTLTKPSRNEIGFQNTNNIQDKFPWNENDNNVLPKKALKEVQRRKEPGEISEESFHECELLIDELILELAKKTSKKPAQQSQAIDQIAELESNIKNSIKNEINSNVKDKHSEIAFATQVDYSESDSDSSDPDKVAMNINKTNTPLIDILKDLNKTPPQTTSATTDEAQLIQHSEEEHQANSNAAEEYLKLQKELGSRIDS